MGNDVLVIGTKFRSDKIDSCNWNEVGGFNSISNYKKVILDFVTLKKENNEINPFKRKNLFSDDDFNQFRFEKSNELIIIGNPEEIILDNKVNYRILEMIDFRVHFVKGRGDNIKLINNKFKTYFKYVKKWEYSIINQELERMSFGLPFYVIYNYKYEDKTKMGITINPIAMNNSGHAIAFSFRFNINGYNKPVFGTMHHKSIESALYIYLPKPTEISMKNAIKLLLKDRYSINIETPAPDWINEYKLPNLERIEIKLNKINEDISELTNEFTEYSLQLEDQKQFQKLLYENGNLLNDIILKVLKLFGAEVTHKEKYQDDGKFDINGMHGILEVKGKKGTCARSDIRQLEDWLDEAENEDKRKYKGVLIINSEIDKIPENRKNPFPEDCKKKAKNEKIALLNTIDLFNLIKTYQNDEFDRDEFWETVFNTNGVCEFTKLKGIEKKDNNKKWKN